jgi:hypothetical protein
VQRRRSSLRAVDILGVIRIVLLGPCDLTAKPHD